MLTDTVTGAVETGKAIGDYGMMAIAAGFFLVLSALVMVFCFRWFMHVVSGLLDGQKKTNEDYKETMEQLLEETRNQNGMLNDLTEGLRTETQLRIRNLSGFAFDLSIEQVCLLIKRMRKENHIADKEATREKIRKSLTVMHEDRKSRFDAFTYRGKRLSEYCNDEWIEKVAKVVEGELYNEKGENDGRAYTNVKLAYDDIRTDFYHKLNN